MVFSVQLEANHVVPNSQVLQLQPSEREGGREGGRVGGWEGGREGHDYVICLQTFICSVSCGPHGKVLCANYQNSEVRSHECHVTVMRLATPTQTFDFQDEVGAVVHDVCQVPPDHTHTALISPPSLSLSPLPSPSLPLLLSRLFQVVFSVSSHRTRC